ncbi:MAG: resolvase [Candidatus Entotheonella factor]|uniref:Resolvase n=1 Tax=Entotheonella factor TaxID=1429438 RepID=W4LSM8_ENTF1|nr:MAG: resolvase [Candidatus Entotheonella factor]
MKIAAYIRISDQSQNIDSQREAITGWLSNHGIELDTVQWFQDTYTGRTTRRPGFEALQKAIFDGTVKTVVVWKLDRIARTIREGVNTIADWCNGDVRLVCVTQQIDLSGPIGQMIGSLMFGVAEIGLVSNKENQARGIAAAKKRGKYKGRKKGTTKARPDRARELQAQGLTGPEIATALGVTERTVWRYLSTP